MITEENRKKFPRLFDEDQCISADYEEMRDIFKSLKYTAERRKSITLFDLYWFLKETNVEIEANDYAIFDINKIFIKKLKDTDEYYICFNDCTVKELEER